MARRHRDSEVPFDEEWAAGIRMAREARRWSQSKVAKLVGASQPDISAIERFSTRKSIFVRPLCKVLERPMPAPTADDPLLQEIYRGVLDLSSSEDDLRVVQAVIDRLRHYVDKQS